MAEFQWWLLIAGLVLGGGLVAVASMSSARRTADIDEDERLAEAGWIATRLRARGEEVDAALADAVLREHAAYLELPPPDALVEGQTARTNDRA